MKVTIDIRLEGCATRCRHCYVNGGPCRRMPADEYYGSLEAMEVVCGKLSQDGHEVSLWLDYEPLLHPEIVRVVKVTKDKLGPFFDVSNLPTSGVPIARRTDRREMLAALGSAGTEKFTLALHGPRDIHDKAAGRPGAYKEMTTAVGRIRQAGFRVALKVIAARDMLARLGEVEQTVGSLECDEVRVENPVYTPVPRLREFETVRATLEDVLPLRERIEALCTAEASVEYWAKAEDFTERAAVSDVLNRREQYPSFASIEDRMPAWVFVTVLPGQHVYYGNAGLYHRRIGSLTRKSAAGIAAVIGSLPPNYQFGGFNDVGKLPAPVEIARHFGNAESGKLYHTREDVLSRWLDIRTRQERKSRKPKAP